MISLIGMPDIEFLSVTAHNNGTLMRCHKDWYMKLLIARQRLFRGVMVAIVQTRLADC